MALNTEASENIGLLRAGKGDLCVDPCEPIEIPNVEQVPPAGQSGDVSGEVSERQREERIEHWMENVKVFIRGIDVKQL